MLRLTPIACLAVLAAVSPAQALTLVQDGKSSYVIALPDQATVVEQTAARELQLFLEEVTGAKLPIRAEKEVPIDTPQIVIGVSARTRQLVPDAGTAAPGPDGICLKTVGQALVLTGSPPRGTLYAMYTFLEDVVGCRWWTSTESAIPKKPTLEIPALDTSYAPPLLSREAFYRDAFSSPFAVRLKLNGHFMQIPRDYGGHIPIVGWCHTFFPILPPAKYFADHPEWYSLVSGRRSVANTQLCLTNESMRQEFVRVVLQRLRDAEDPRIISVSQNDCGGRCQCEACAALEQSEGSASGPLIHFVNAVAEEVEKEFPDVFVETLAYQYTRQAPQHVRPRRNVLIRLCSIECSYAQPLGTGPQNEKFRTDMEQWSAIAPQLYVWNYVTNFANFLLPHPNLRSLDDDIRFFVKHKTVGLFEQGDAYTTTGDFIRQRTWVLAHLLWDPRRDQASLVHEFLEGYYGPAAPHLQAYLDLLEDAAEKSGVYLRCYMQDTSAWLSPEVLLEATRHFDRAAQAVSQDPVLAQRIQRERLPLDLVWLTRYYALRSHAKRQGVEFLGPQDPLAACRKWIELNRQFGNRSYGEGRPFDEYAQGLLRRFRPPAAPPDFCRGLPEDDWIDIQDNRFQLHQPGTASSIVDDPNASDGAGARMPGDHVQWAVQYRVGDELPDAGPWHCYVFARCDAKAQQGQAMHLGLYDSAAKQSVAGRDVTIEESAGTAYKPFDLGVHQLRPSEYFWAAPRNNPAEVTAVLIDRIVLVRERK